MSEYGFWLAHARCFRPHVGGSANAGMLAAPILRAGNVPRQGSPVDPNRLFGVAMQRLVRADHSAVR